MTRALCHEREKDTYDNAFDYFFFVLEGGGGCEVMNVSHLRTPTIVS